MGVDLFGATTPRADVLSGVLTDAVFAASLDEVIEGSAPDAYGDPQTFFSATYPSGGLRSLLDEVLGRLGGNRPDGAPVVRIETNLGGGKTHNLIALLHAARGHLDPVRAMEFMDPTNMPSEPVPRIGAFVGTASGATSFPPVAGVSAMTLWGYLALQLGGNEGYELVRADDEALTAPGARALLEIMSDSPTLILIDEIARYLAVADGHAVGKGTLADQTAAFLMALMEAVGSHPRAALVITTTQVTDAFGDKTAQVLAAFAQAQSLIARKEHVLRPSEEADLPKILARRLFEAVDAAAAKTVGADYLAAATSAVATGTDLPERMTGPSFATEVDRCYPFHPDLITVLDKRLSTIPNFQRTRGALRLLARTVRLLWALHLDGTELIHLHHIDLSDKDTAEDLSSRLDKATFEPVIRADIASQPGSEPAHAEVVDHHMDAPYACRLATTAYLYSLTRDVPGVPAPALVGAVLVPGDDPNVIVKALDNLDGAAWYLHTDAHGYRFAVEPSLTKLIQEAEGQVTQGKAKSAATDILAAQFKDSALKVKRTWEDAKVPDRDDDAWLVVLHWDEFGSESGVTDPGVTPPQVTATWEWKPAGGVREYRNRLVFLAPQADSHEAMLRSVKRLLALRDLAGSTDTLRSLPDEKRKEVTDKAKQAELEARVAVCNHVNLLYVPANGQVLEPIELDVVTTASVKPNQTEAILDRLAAMEKTLAAGDKPLDPGWIKSKLGAQLNQAVATNELVRAFARRTDLKLVLDRGQLTALVAAGVRNGVWEYHDPERGTEGWATEANPAIAVRLSEDTTINPNGSAPPIPSHHEEVDLLPPLPHLAATSSPAGATFSAEGKADVALQGARQAAADAGRRSVGSLRISVEELGADTGTHLAKLITMLPPSTPGAEVFYLLSVRVALGDPSHSLELTFNGPAAEYQPLRPAMDHVLKQHEASLRASVAGTFDPPMSLSGQELEDLIGRAGDTGPAKCSIQLTTEVDE